MRVADTQRLTTDGARQVLATAIESDEADRVAVCVAAVDPGGT